ncbi:MFS transporter [Amycolatopsis sp. H6(2020)]|nr:MFS transporter [Amycolatopsis sp. H6(2020)]
MTRQESAGGTEKKRPVLAAVTGHFIEVYDAALYGLFVLPIAKAFFPAGNDDRAFLAALIAFGASFVARPIGGIAVGLLADRIGRQKTLVATILVVGSATAAVGALPTYAQAGTLAPILLFVCRIVQGFASGGETTVIPVYLGEQAEPRRRGLITSLIAVAGNAATVLAALAGATLSARLPPAAFDSWGWRTPFLAAIPLAVLGFHLRRKLSEPLPGQDREGFRFRFRKIRANWKTVAQLSLLGGLGTPVYLLIVYYPSFLIRVSGLPEAQARLMPLILIAGSALLNPAVGVLGDRLGRRVPLLLAAGISIATAVPAFSIATGGTLAGAIIGGILLALPIPLCLGSIHAVSMELYPRDIRATAGGLASTVGGLVFSGLPPVVIQLLSSTSVGHTLAPALVLMTCGSIGLLAALRLPDTRTIRIDQ